MVKKNIHRIWSLLGCEVLFSRKHSSEAAGTSFASLKDSYTFGCVKEKHPITWASDRATLFQINAKMFDLKDIPKYGVNVPMDTNDVYVPGGEVGLTLDYQSATNCTEGFNAIFSSPKECGFLPEIYDCAQKRGFL